MSKISAALKQQIVEDYLGGAKIEQIETDTRVSRTAIYACIREAGYTPSRRTKSSPVHARDLMEQLAEANRTIGRLEAKIEYLEAQVQTATSKR